MEDTKHCPYCDEVIKINAVKCKHCGSTLPQSKLPTGEFTAELQVKIALEDRFEIVSQIGSGGMATVYKAVQKNLKRLVALKVIHKNLINDKEFLERFHREAQLSASLNHHNIVTIYDEGSADGIHYIAMEYIEGADLHSMIRDKGRFTIDETINIIAPISEALDYAHNKGIVHRDIKSSNIIIDANGKPILTDFGIAHAVSETKLTRTGMVIGTPEYMSPEQVISGHVDAQSDLYSLGIVLYECLTGDIPFRGETPISTIYKIVNENVEPINKKIPDAPKWLGTIIDKVLSKNKKKRFKSGKEFSNALRSKQEQFNTTLTSGGEETVVITQKNMKELQKQFHPWQNKKRNLLIGLALFIFICTGFLLYFYGYFPFTSKNNFSSLSDFEKRRVELLLEEGDMLYQTNKLIEPSGKNAVEKYSDVLKINAANKYAKDKLENISVKVADETKEYIDGNNLDKAREYLKLSQQYFPSNKLFLPLIKRVTIKDLELKLDKLVNQNPIEALKVCKTIDSLDTGNKHVAAVYPAIKNNMINNADGEFSKRNYREALNQYNQIKTIFGDDNSISQKITKTNSALRSSLVYSADREFEKSNYDGALKLYNNVSKYYGEDAHVKEMIDKINSKLQEAKTTTIPSVIGLTVEDAENAFKNNSLIRGKISEIISPKNKGKVIAQIPKSGTVVKQGTEVNLIVGK